MNKTNVDNKKTEPEENLLKNQKKICNTQNSRLLETTILFFLSLYTLWLIFLEISYLDQEWILDENKNLVHVDVNQLYHASLTMYEKKLKFHVSTGSSNLLLKSISTIIIILSLLMKPNIKLIIFAYTIVIYNALLKVANYITSIYALSSEGKSVGHYFLDVCVWFTVEVIFIYFIQKYLDFLITTNVQRAICKKFPIIERKKCAVRRINLRKSTELSASLTNLDRLTKNSTSGDNDALFQSKSLICLQNRPSQKRRASEESLLTKWSQTIKKYSQPNNVDIKPFNIQEDELQNDNVLKRNIEVYSSSPRQRSAQRQQDHVPIRVQRCVETSILQSPMHISRIPIKVPNAYTFQSTETTYNPTTSIDTPASAVNTATGLIVKIKKKNPHLTKFNTNTVHRTNDLKSATSSTL